MVVIGIVVLDSILMKTKVHILTICIFLGEYEIIFTIVCYSKLVLGILQYQHIGYGSLIKPHLPIHFYIVFAVGIDTTAITLNFNLLIGCPDFCGEFLVAKCINCGLFVIKKCLWYLILG